MHGVTTTNPLTGLHETIHDKFKIPVVQQLGPERIRFDGNATAIHTVPMPHGKSLDFYAKLTPAPELYVSLHGAVSPKNGRYPMFWRMTSMRHRVDAFMSIADPSLQLSNDPDFSLAWYTGGEGWDPIYELADVVRRAMDYSGAERVMFLGGSGGGFASMRMATMFSKSIAFVQDPQTKIAAYYKGHQQRLAEAAWPGMEMADVIQENPDRFDMCYLFRETDPDCFVYYRQSTGDPHHTELHARPFEEAVARTAGWESGRFKMVYEEGEQPGHGMITPGEFDRHFDEAVAWWRRSLTEVV